MSRPEWLPRPDDPRAPPQDVWDALTPAERARVIAALPAQGPTRSRLDAFFGPGRPLPRPGTPLVLVAEDDSVSWNARRAAEVAAQDAAEAPAAAEAERANRLEARVGELEAELARRER